MTSMSKLHRAPQGSPVRRALDAIPDYVDAEKRLDMLTAFRLPAAVSDAAETLAGYVADVIRNGDPVRADLIEEAAHLTAQQTSYGIASEALRRAQSELASDLEAIVNEHRDKIPRHRSRPARGRERGEVTLAGPRGCGVRDRTRPCRGLASVAAARGAIPPRPVGPYDRRQ